MKELVIVSLVYVFRLGSIHNAIISENGHISAGPFLGGSTEPDPELLGSHKSSGAKMGISASCRSCGSRQGLLGRKGLSSPSPKESPGPRNGFTPASACYFTGRNWRAHVRLPSLAWSVGDATPSAITRLTLLLGLLLPSPYPFP